MLLKRNMNKEEFVTEMQWQHESPQFQLDNPNGSA